METSAVVVNGQGDVCAKQMSKGGVEEDVASILENIANIVDDTSDLELTASQKQDEQTTEKSNDTLSKSVQPKFVLSLDNGEDILKDSATDTEILTVENISESSEQPLTSLPSILSSKESHDCLQRMSPEPAKTVSDSTAVLAVNEINAPSSSSSLATQEQDVSKSKDSISTSFSQEEEKLIAETSGSSLTKQTLLPAETTKCSCPSPSSNQADQSLSNTVSHISTSDAMDLLTETNSSCPPAKTAPGLDSETLVSYNPETECTKNTHPDLPPNNSLKVITQDSDSTVKFSPCPPNSQAQEATSPSDASRFTPLTPGSPNALNKQQTLDGESSAPRNNEPEPDHPQSLKMDISENGGEATDSSSEMCTEILDCGVENVRKCGEENVCKGGEEKFCKDGEEKVCKGGEENVCKDGEENVCKDGEEKVCKGGEDKLGEKSVENAKAILRVSSVSENDAALLRTCGNTNKEELCDSIDMELEANSNNICSIQILESSSISNINGFSEEDMVCGEAQASEKVNNDSNDIANERDQSGSKDINCSTHELSEIEKSTEGNMDKNVPAVTEKSEISDTNVSAQEEKLVTGVKDDEVAVKTNHKMDSDFPSKDSPKAEEERKRMIGNLEERVTVKENSDESSADKENNQNETDAVIVIGEEDSENTSITDAAETHSLKDAPKANENSKSTVEKLDGKAIMESEKATPTREIANTNKDGHATKTENKILNNEEKTEPTSHELPCENVKKRSFSTDESCAIESKRQKLDFTVKDVPEPEACENNTMEVIDSDDDVILAEDPSPNVEVSKLDKVESSDQAKLRDCEDDLKDDSARADVKGSDMKYDIADADVKSCDLKDDMACEDVKDSDLKDDMACEDVKDMNLPPTILSNQVLQVFITARIKSFIKKQKQQQIDKLHQRISIMQSSTSLWKETAKHLERSVKEVTVLNQGVEKRRAHVNACKKLSSRTVGTQVNDDKVKSALTTAQSVPQGPGRGPEAVASTSSLGPSVLLNPPTSQHHWNTQQQVYTPPRPQAPLARPSAPTASSRYTRLPAPPAPSICAPPPPSDVVNLIDLTDDDEVSKKSSHQNAANTQAAAAHGYRTNVVIGGGKAASHGGNGFIPVPPNRTIMTTVNQHNPSVAGPQSQTYTSPASLSQSQSRQNSKVAQKPNHALASGSASGNPSSIGMSSRAAQQGSAPGKHTQDSSSAALTSKPNWIAKHTLPPSLFIQQQRHPAPLPQSTETVVQNVRALKVPPKPTLKISRVSQGIVLSWNMPTLTGVEVISSYQLFAYQETDSAPKTSLWKKVGDVRALPLPMACTLTQFLEGNKYHFAVRAVDKFNRTGAFSDPSSIFLGIGSTNTKIAFRG